MSSNGKESEEEVKLAVLMMAVEAMDFYLSHPARHMMPDMVGTFILAGAKDFLDDQMEDFNTEEWEEYLNENLPNKKNAKVVALRVLDRLEPIVEHFEGTGVLDDRLVGQLEELKQQYKEI